jgi:hypothetical protein
MEVQMLSLGPIPDTADPQFWEDCYQLPDGTVQSGKFVVWPASVHVKLARFTYSFEKLIRVRIRTLALCKYDERSDVDTRKVNSALMRHRDFIERLARSKYRPGDLAVTLDMEDFGVQD